MNRYCFALLLTCLTAWSANFPDTSTDQQVIVNSNNVAAGSSSLRWSFTNTRLTVGPTGLGSRVDVEGATPAWRLYAGGNPATSYSRLEGFWDSAAQTYYLRENVSGSNAIPFVVGINSGATLTFNIDGSARHSGGLGLSGATNLLTISGNQLYLDGVPVVGGTIPSQTVSNLTVINNLTVKGKTASFTSANGTNVLQPNFKDTATVTWAYDGGSNLTATATSSGGGLTTDVTTLAYSGTNITGFDASTNGMSYYLLLTNHCLFGSSTFANLPAKTAYKTFTLCLQQDSAGTWVPKFTNTIVGWADGVQPVVKTNGGAVSYLYFHTGLATNSTLVGTPNLNIQ